MASRDVPWAEYTGTVSPFGDIKPCWCAWRNDRAIFMVKIDNNFVAAIGGDQDQVPLSSIEGAQKVFWDVAKNHPSIPTGISRAHILNFQKR